MEQLLQEIVASTNGKYSLSNILDLLDSLRRQKRIDMPMFEQIYKRIINESRTNGDKWFEKYMTTTSLNFSFDLKRSFANDENQPNLINKLLSDNRSTNTIKTETCKPFTSPSNLASPPTYETKCSRMTDYQSDNQKQLTNQILQQMQSSDRRRASEHNKSIQVSFHQQNYTEGTEKLKQFIQRKILQQERQALNKIIYVINEPVKVTKFTIRNPQVLENNVNDFIEQREIKIKFNYFDCLKQYWIRRRFLKNAAIKILASRKTNYIKKAFRKLNCYAIKYKHKKNHLSQAIYSFDFKINRKYFDQWKLFINLKRTKHCSSSIIIGFKKMQNKIQIQKCFKFLKQYTTFKRENKKQFLFAQAYHESILKHKILKLWGQLAESSQVLQMNEFIQQKFLRAWKCVTIQRQYKQIQKQVACKKYKQTKQTQILKIFKEFMKLIQTNKKLNEQMRQLSSVKQMKFVIKILSENVIKQQMKKRYHLLINQFLCTKYIRKPLLELNSYARQQSIKKELYKRIDAIRIKNLLFKLIQNWGLQVQVKKHHQFTQQTALPKLKQFQLYLYFKRYRISFKQSLHLKKLNKIMKFKKMKEFLKEIKLITVKFKQEFKYPLKLKKQVFAAFRQILDKKSKKLQFHDQLHTLHEMNMQRSIFEFMRRRGAMFRRKKQLMRSMKNFQFGKYLAGPFYFLLKYSQNHLARKHLKNNFTKLYIVKTFQKSFNQLSKYSWKRRMQALKDQQNVPKIIAQRKIKIIRNWNAKCHSAKKIDMFCYNFEKMQVRIFFKHMQLIKITDYQKKKYMIQGRLYYLMKFTFKKLKQYHTRQQTCRQHQEIIKRRQVHRYQKSTFNHIRRLYTFEHNIAYLTAYTILHIKKQLLQKYFKGFQHILLNKKRPRDQIMKLNKKRKLFKGWIKYTNKNKAIKYFMASMYDIKMNYSIELLQQLEQIKQSQYANEQASEFYIYNLKTKTFKQWHKIIETSQKYQYLFKLLNKQLIKKYQIGLDSIQQENEYQLQKQLEDYRKSQQLKKQALSNLLDLLNQKQHAAQTEILETFQLNSKFIQIEAQRHISLKYTTFQHWKKIKMLKYKLNILHELSEKHQAKQALRIFSMHNKSEKLRDQNRRFILINKLQCWRRKFLQLQKLKEIEVLVQYWDVKSQQSALKQILNNHTILKFREYQNQKISQKIFQFFVQEHKLKQRALDFAQKLQNIFSGRLYFKECGSFFFYQLKDYQIQQLKGEVVLRTFDKLLDGKKRYIFGRLAQNTQFSNFTQRRQWIKQIKCFAEWAKFTNQQIALKYIGKTIQKVQPQDFGKILKLSKEGIQDTLFPDQIERENFLQLNKDSNEKLLNHSKYMLLKNYQNNQLKNKFLKIWFQHQRLAQASNILTQLIDQHWNQNQVQIYYKRQLMNILKQDKNTQQTLDNFNSIILKKYTQVIKKTFESTRLYGKSNQIKKNKRKQSFKQWHKLSKFNCGIENLTNTLQILVNKNLSQKLNLMAYKSKKVHLNKIQIFKMKQKYLKYWQRRFKQKDVALVFIPILQQMINKRKSFYIQQFQVELQFNAQAVQQFQNLVMRNAYLKIVSEINQLANFKAKQNSQLTKLKQKQRQQLVYNCFVEWNKLFNQFQRKKYALEQISKIVLGVQRYNRGQELMKALKLEKKLQVKQEIEINQSLLYSVFISWRMQTNENKMLKKYLHECQVEEKRSHSFPKY